MKSRKLIFAVILVFVALDAGFILHSIYHTATAKHPSSTHVVIPPLSIPSAAPTPTAQSTPRAMPSPSVATLPPPPIATGNSRRTFSFVRCTRNFAARTRRRFATNAA